MHPHRLLTVTGLLLGLATLALQFSLSIPVSMANGASFGRAVALFFSFLTILTHSILVLVYLSALTPWRTLHIFRLGIARALLAGVVLLVGLYYHFVLAPTKNWQGAWLLADTFLHYILPVLYLLWWALTQPHGELRFTDLPRMLLPPLAYVPYALIMGWLTRSYPYPIIDLGRLPAAVVAVNVVQVVAGLAVLMLLVIAADRALVRLRKPGPA